MNHIVLSALLLACSEIASAQQTITTIGPVWADPAGVAVDSAGNVFVADAGVNIVYKLAPTGSQIIVAGKGSRGFSGDGGPATAAQLDRPRGLAVDSSGNLFISDYGNNCIRKVTAAGTITTVAGGGRPADGIGDGGPAPSARLQLPWAVALDATGNLFIADTSNSRIRRLDSRGIITTVAGTDTHGFSGEGGPATLARIHTPSGIAVDRAGNLYIADTFNNRVRRVDSRGIINTVAGSDNGTYSGDGGPAASAGLHYPYAVAVDGNGALFIADTFSLRVRAVNAAGTISTIAGTGGGGFQGDGGDATKATLSSPNGLATDAQGNLYIVDSGNRRIRKVSAATSGPSNPGPASAAPSIASVLVTFRGRGSFTSNSYLEIYGTNLSQTSRAWAGADFSGPAGPTTLAGVSVTLNGKPATISYISPAQLNVIAPDDTAEGPVEVVVKNATGASSPFMATRSHAAPALHTDSRFMTNGRQHLVAQTADFRSFVGSPGMVPGVVFAPAKRGDTIVFYALGCGPTVPPSPAGSVVSAAAPLALPYEVRIGGRVAAVQYAGAVADTVGLYQFNVVVPDIADGEQPIEVSVAGIANGQNLVLQVGQQPPIAAPSPTVPLPTVPPAVPGASVTSVHGASFGHPEDWLVSEVKPATPPPARSGETLTEIYFLRPRQAPQSDSQLIAVIFSRLASGPCNSETIAIDYGPLIKPTSTESDPSDWLNWSAPSSHWQYFVSGDGFVTNLESKDKKRRRSITAICGRGAHADRYVVVLSISEPVQTQTLTAYEQVAYSATFAGGPFLPSEEGRWMSVPAGPGELTFDSKAGTVRSDAPLGSCSGSYRRTTGTIEFQWTSSCLPFVSNVCGIDVTHTGLTLLCPNKRWDFKRPEW